MWLLKRWKLTFEPGSFSEFASLTPCVHQAAVLDRPLIAPLAEESFHTLHNLTNIYLYIYLTTTPDISFKTNLDAFITCKERERTWARL